MSHKEVKQRAERELQKELGLRYDDCEHRVVGIGRYYFCDWSSGEAWDCLIRERIKNIYLRKVIGI